MTISVGYSVSKVCKQITVLSYQAYTQWCLDHLEKYSVPFFNDIKTLQYLSFQADPAMENENRTYL